jgi:quercetin dioxygenase-like cupin family protein
MIEFSRTKTAAKRALVAIFAFTALTGGALAGECPADKVVADGKGQPMSTAAAKGVTDTVIGSIDLANEAPRLADRKFRLRRLVIQPGGVVPWHSHGERPAIIYIVSGTIVEYRSNCAVPILHHGGQVAEETHTTSHWWKNTTRKPVVLLSADILHDKADPKTM